MSERLAIIVVKIDELQKEGKELKAMTKDLRALRVIVNVYREMRNVGRFD